MTLRCGGRRVHSECLGPQEHVCCESWGLYLPRKHLRFARTRRMSQGTHLVATRLARIILVRGLVVETCRAYDIQSILVFFVCFLYFFALVSGFLHKDHTCACTSHTENTGFGWQFNTNELTRLYKSSLHVLHLLRPSSRSLIPQYVHAKNSSLCPGSESSAADDSTPENTITSTNNTALRASLQWKDRRGRVGAIAGTYSKACPLAHILSRCVWGRGEVARKKTALQN